MRKVSYIVFIIFIMFINILHINASCTKEELAALEEAVSNIKITYKHLGEVTKEDGTKVYNEFMVTASNVEEGLYIHLSPMSDDNFERNGNTVKIKLTSGNWKYQIISSKCEKKVKDINVKIPRFNIYSLDPLCEGINSNDFTLCSKYYEYEFSRETFERKVKAYRLQNKIGQEKPTIEKENTLNKIFNLIEKYRFYIASILTIILLILITLIISSRRKKKKVLE